MKKFYNEEVLKKAYNNGEKYLIRGWSAYQIHYSAAQNTYYLHKLYTTPRQGNVPLVNLGHYMCIDGEFLNRLLGFELVNC